MTAEHAAAEAAYQTAWNIFQTATAKFRAGGDFNEFFAAQAAFKQALADYDAFESSYVPPKPEKVVAEDNQLSLI